MVIHYNTYLQVPSNLLQIADVGNYSVGGERAIHLR